jgi:hypothetical protein
MIPLILDGAPSKQAILPATADAEEQSNRGADSLPVAIFPQISKPLLVASWVYPPLFCDQVNPLPMTFVMQQTSSLPVSVPLGRAGVSPPFELLASLLVVKAPAFTYDHAI